MNRSSSRKPTVVQLTVPMDLTIEAEARDYEIVCAYLRLHSIVKVSRELAISRRTVTRATSRFLGTLKRAQKDNYVTTVRTAVKDAPSNTNETTSNTV